MVIQAISIIPARMASTRLPGKPLATIAGAPMIVHVLRAAERAETGPVYVACAEQEIADAVAAQGGNAVLTCPDHPSGTDRIAEALEKIDPDHHYDVVVNVQGDLPTMSPQIIQDVLRPLVNPEMDMATLVAPIESAEELHNPNVVKAVVSFDEKRDTGRALYFTRAPAPSGEGPHWHHIGIYAYRRETLRRFTALPASPLEQQERLEQLRALEAGMVIGVAISHTVPFGVDTPEDLEKARKLLGEYDE
ncbi:MAG: 3-deoxy-manno-octulosonate cytidylyltransferase [Hyphomicrobiales bacterium]|nr:3-deoxy-manno-octulosonate cytidylyltransferase [Rickettsiales bacterium]MCP5361080.1 3-deoxy-manno-octulosonate cytidylyltransferase [Hyphomicrobiales bacterium]